MSPDAHIPVNPEIEQELQKLEKKNVEEATLSFFSSANIERETGMAGFIIRYSGGLVKGGTSANLLLFIFAILMLTSSVLVFKNNAKPNIRDISNIPPEQFVPGSLY